MVQFYFEKCPIISNIIQKHMNKIVKNHRVVIENVTPQIDSGDFPIKRGVGEIVSVKAVIFADAHDDVSAALLYRRINEKKWHEISMAKSLNDQWHASFTIESQEGYIYTVCGWVNEFTTWQKKLSKFWAAGQDVRLEMKEGAILLKQAANNGNAREVKWLRKWAEDFNNEKKIFSNAYIAQSGALSELMKKFGVRKSLKNYIRELKVHVDRPKALFSAWYEIFPRSFGQKEGTHGTFKDCERLLPDIALMGFDVLYFPPIHPIGVTKRKGKNNALTVVKSDPGSPWAVGSKEGGHKSIHHQLGTVQDLKELIAKAKTFEIEIALDIAFQCSPDHPYVKKHPQWFKWRPDKTIQYAENPPKKYEDIYPINFDNEDYQNLIEELKSVFVYWIKQGVRIFRVDNPHTKPFAFWDWVIDGIRQEHPDVLFLAEAFTRPHVMQRLAKGGFHQSYTYFTWRTSKWDFEQYMSELTQSEMREYFRPNFWPNTPDILPFHLQHGGRPAFMQRLVLAATLSSNYGIYAPAYELCVSEAIEGKEEYYNSEKYELKAWNRDADWSLKDFITRVNKIRRENPALQSTFNYKSCLTNNEQILCFQKVSPDKSNIILTVVNLDPYSKQSAMICVPVEDFGIGYHRHYTVCDLLTNAEYTWYQDWNYVELDPYSCPAHIFKISMV